MPVTTWKYTIFTVGLFTASFAFVSISALCTPCVCLLSLISFGFWHSSVLLLSYKFLSHWSALCPMSVYASDLGYNRQYVLASRSIDHPDWFGGLSSLQSNSSTCKVFTVQSILCVRFTVELQ